MGTFKGFDSGSNALLVLALSIRAWLLLDLAPTALEACPNPMVQSPLDTLGLDPSLLKRVEHLVGNLLATNIGVLLLVVVAGESIETTSINWSQLTRIEKGGYTYS
jgi:hypothetical protein